MTMGHHIIASLRGCSINLINNTSRLNSLLNQVVIEANFHKVGEISTIIKEDTLSSFVLLSESHISIYSNPENGHVELDVFCCSGEDSARLAINSLIKHLNPESHQVKEIPR
ncbi:adenosylmethionine decarboxylase [Candidatus Woesearchaeota archaeon]|jgi:S-adenosylmethionine decarboxylase proenzyme|nr:adenosylmethionine decarboxylase [Candidatus Woesearchaeota archaeon]MBT5272715.1 adenosylmethionine decarboxylase [Candidatus Woesearchaeota archaeon]MBT6040326.1 adenosylmethionine decarboxylase [Candidatus Woesearchaeota archaeon]MBT6337040.1 adenosylmethionine decarboxylase [Candidatus Woesearchaeota archaeon]MBT7927906.1 adenosylmethionine decarboxylase [Candidatus Woesearchaeota archaeon]